MVEPGRLTAEELWFPIWKGRTSHRVLHAIKKWLQWSGKGRMPCRLWKYVPGLPQPGVHAWPGRVGGVCAGDEEDTECMLVAGSQGWDRHVLHSESQVRGQEGAAVSVTEEEGWRPSARDRAGTIRAPRSMQCVYYSVPPTATATARRPPPTRCSSSQKSPWGAENPKWRRVLDLELTEYDPESME